ncbi:hypothetical protein E1218_23510 [Kribbella turkmenica]|uniref:TPM domain-containing protein n=1 Tax=Kribbella turkmenica TaxID=2530375 RepID=A0A4R4WQI2_9ACTN|nr:hypothetical protein [Kribbella turkmenica]TDD19733.1 hypothetical protein E1218_23510 [Kribbella turkmenica]
MKIRLALTVVLTLLVSLTAVPAQAQTPAERAEEIAAALAKEPLYVDPAYETALPDKLREDVLAKTKALEYPVYSIVLPLTPSDAFQGKERNVLTLVIDALDRPGLYVVVDGGGRFPWYEAHEVPQLNEDKLRAVRERALDDTGYDAGPTEVLSRMYELLAAPGIPAPAQTTRPGRAPRDSSDVEESPAGTVVLLVGLGIAALVGLGLVIGLRRPGARHQDRPRREKPFTIPPHVAATVAAERRRRLAGETTAELTVLGSKLAALPAAEGTGLRHQQAALDAHQAAGKVLDASEDLVDVVGAMVLLDKARREYDAAVAVAAGRKQDAVPDLCAFNPLHGRSSGQRTQVEADGTTLALPLCAECRRALKRGKAPASLPGDDGPYWHGDDLWARTFFGTLDADLAGAVSRGDHRS